MWEIFEWISRHFPEFLASLSGFGAGLGLIFGGVKVLFGNKKWNQATASKQKLIIDKQVEIINNQECDRLLLITQQEQMAELLTKNTELKEQIKIIADKQEQEQIRADVYRSIVLSTDSELKLQYEQTLNEKIKELENKNIENEETNEDGLEQNTNEKEEDKTPEIEEQPKQEIEETPNPDKEKDKFNEIQSDNLVKTDNEVYYAD